MKPLIGIITSCIRCTTKFQALRRLMIFGVLSISVIASAEQRLIPIGERRLSINCDGRPGNSATVVLMAGGGRTAEDWVNVQPTVASFTA
jgi:hypothetical protein